MSEFPTTLDRAIAQAKEATQNALNDGFGRIQVDLAIPEIALQAQAIALQFTTLFESYGSGLKVFFPDTGAAALARRDWEETNFKIGDLGSSRKPIETKIAEDDRIFIVVSPSSVEVNQLEKLCNFAEDRPVIILIPQLESVATVGIGYAARQLRERFLSTIQTAYYLKPFEGGAILRFYPSQWQVWQETQEDEYKIIGEYPQKPTGELLEQIFNPTAETSSGKMPKKAGFLSNLQQIFRALNQ
ncbi:DUF1995 family protein [Lusitaniella coriacea LEGE 07157]|uniref:DUF1995 family protein n=1 Tax=Lusitaniella coriacea LEGE 07157 TaxID=945747 RepID=A0A8J7JBE1_9CYAN|nr:DUF1995 family protein [Lusitaniella coriacea]MBE9116805.1 DUF1995 family protein [Lusitaniella coriacea LEGE 07157]